MFGVRLVDMIFAVYVWQLHDWCGLAICLAIVVFFVGGGCICKRTDFVHWEQSDCPYCNPEDDHA